jgi:hypothetical protein
MITIKNIIEASKPHRNGLGGRQTMIKRGDILISIVGGSTGLYGDFESTFEVAVIDTKMDNFVTKHFFPEANDDVMGYLEKEEIEDKINQIVKKNFQFL